MIFEHSNLLLSRNLGLLKLLWGCWSLGVRCLLRLNWWLLRRLNARSLPEPVRSLRHLSSLLQVLCSGGHSTPAGAVTESHPAGQAGRIEHVPMSVFSHPNHLLSPNSVSRSSSVRRIPVCRVLICTRTAVGRCERCSIGHLRKGCGSTLETHSSSEITGCSSKTSTESSTSASSTTETDSSTVESGASAETHTHSGR